MQESRHTGDLLYTVEDQQQLQVLEAELLAAAAEHEELASVTPINAAAAAVLSTDMPVESPQEIGISVQVDPVSGRRVASRPQGAPKSATVSQDAPQGVMGGRFSEVQQKIYKNGAKHVYGIDADGKKRHLSHDEILEAYAQDGQYQGKHVKTEEPSVQMLEQELSRPEDAADEAIVLSNDIVALVAEAQKVYAERDEEAFRQSVSLILENLQQVADSENWSDAKRSAAIAYVREQIVLGAESRQDDALADGTPEVPVEHESTEETVVLEPVTNTEPKTIRERAKRIFAKGATKLAEARIMFGEGLGKVDRYLADEEKGQTRRRVLGSVVGAAVLAYMYVDLMHAGGGTALGTPKGPSHETVKHVTETLDHQGDTVWSHAQHDLISQGNLHPSELQIQNETQRLLDLNNMSWEDATHLDVGTKLKVS